LRISNSETKNKISEVIDCSSSKDGVCNIHRIISLYNSHSGTHADQPYHFLQNPPFKYFNDFQYNGPCHIIDLSEFDIEGGIKIEDFEKLIKEDDFNEITRLLFCTYPNSPPEEWNEKFKFYY
jgi:kynurenine formamidase